MNKKKEKKETEFLILYSYKSKFSLFCLLATSKYLLLFTNPHINDIISKQASFEGLKNRENFSIYYVIFNWKHFIWKGQDFLRRLFFFLHKNIFLLLLLVGWFSEVVTYIHDKIVSNKIHIRNRIYEKDENKIRNQICKIMWTKATPLSCLLMKLIKYFFFWSKFVFQIVCLT